jgi:hypothetical protein
MAGRTGSVSTLRSELCAPRKMLIFAWRQLGLVRLLTFLRCPSTANNGISRIGDVTPLSYNTFALVHGSLNALGFLAANLLVFRNRVLELLKYTPSDTHQTVRILSAAPRATTPVTRAPRVASAPADPRTHPADGGNLGEARTRGVARTSGTPQPARAPQREKTQAHLDELNDFG